jgi:hypothetical protein
MHLKRRSGAELGNAAFDRCCNCSCLVLAECEQNHLLRLHDGTDTHRKGVLGNIGSLLEETGVILAPSQITELIIEYVENLCKKYGVYMDGIGSHFAIDCAAADLITQLRFNINAYHTVKGFTQKNIINNNSVVNNCFAKNMVKIVDFGGYYDYHSRRFVPTTADTEPLVYQLESVVWKDYKLDPAIPNDFTDALTYGLNEYFINPNNLWLPKRQGAYEE